MARPALTFEARTRQPAKVARALADSAAELGKPAGGLVFVAGSLSSNLGELADAVHELRLGFPIVIVAGSGVLTERAELEGVDAATGLLWRGGRVELCAVEADSEDDLSDGLLQLLQDRTGRTDPTVMLFARTELFTTSTLTRLRDGRRSANLFGAGAIGHPGVVGIDPVTGPFSGAAVLVILRGLSAPRIRSTHACRLLGPLQPITEVRGNGVMKIGDRPALDVLAELGGGLEDQPLVFTVLADPADAAASQGGRDEVVVRGVQGIDPDNGGLMISDEVRVGMRITFAVKDPEVARRDLEAVARELNRDIAGAAPRFALYINCAGRGSSLYGGHDVDVRILRSHFGELPIAGMQSSFEIAPLTGAPAFHLYSGVFVLFTQLS